MEAALNGLKSSVNTLKSNVKSDDKPKIDALESSIQSLQKATDDWNGVSGITTVAKAAANVATSADDVVHAVQAGCPSS